MSRTPSHTYSSLDARSRMLLDDDLMREMLADVGQMRTALELELWASWLLGQLWKQRVEQPLYGEVDWMLALGAPLVAMLARIGGARARKALTALSMLERGALGNYAGAVALTLPGARTPAYVSEMATARIVAAHRAVSAADGEAVLLDVERSGRPECGIAVFLDARSAGSIKWARLVGVVTDEFAAQVSTAGPGLEPAEVASVAAHLLDAVDLADADPRSGTRHEFADLRAFLLARLLDTRASDADGA